MDAQSKELLILWTTADRDSAEHMVFMYGYNAKSNNWWDRVTLLIWGGATRLIASDSELQEKLKQLQEADVEIIACKRCAERLDLVQKLEELHIHVFYTGQFLTEWMKADKKILTV
jgi:hypothetical protein